MVWWEVYGLVADPMTNSPVPASSPNLLVRTNPIVELEGYLTASTGRGGVYLVNGGYGSGKTSVLNAVEHLSEKGRPSEVVFLDISRYQTVDALTDVFKLELAPKVESIKSSGKRPILALDQLHNIDTDVTQQFFRERQVAFERLKEHGVIIIFAGDERFALLARSGGPLGAIFDGEFRIPRFEEELARELLRLRFMSCAESDQATFPFSPEAVSTLVKKGSGNPRRLVEDARLVMRFAANLSPPITISKEGVLAATAELTERALGKIRSELRSPILSNALAKLTRIHSGPRGNEKIHELSRLLDLALEEPEAILEDLCADLKDLKLKVEVVTQAAVDAGLTEPRQRRRRSRYGTVSEDVTTLSRYAVAALSSIKSETGLVPSQYLVRVCEEGSIVAPASATDSVLSDLISVKDACELDRARNFLHRAIQAYPSISTSEGVDESVVLAVVTNVVKGVCLELLNDTKPGVVESATEVIKLSRLAQPEEAQFNAHLAKWEELRTLYEDRGVQWTEEQFQHAKTASAGILNVVTEKLVSRAQRTQPPDVTLDPDTLSRMISESQAGTASLLEQPAEQLEELPERLPSLLFRGVKDSEVECVLGCASTIPLGLSLLDRLAYEQVIENERAWLQKGLAGILDCLLVSYRDSKGKTDGAIVEGARMFGHLGEQCRALVRRQAEPGKLSSAIEERLHTKEGRLRFAQMQESVDSISHQTKWLAQIRDLISSLRAARSYEELSDASLVLWYLFRNSVAHAYRSFRLDEYRTEVVHSLVLAIHEMLMGILSKIPGDNSGLVVVGEMLTPDAVAVESRFGRQLAVCNQNVRPWDICLASTCVENDGRAVVWTLRKPIGSKDLEHATEEWISQLPPGTRQGFLAFKNRSDILTEDRIFAFQAAQHRGGAYPITFYGIAAKPQPVRIVPPVDDDESHRWIEELARNSSYFLGGIKASNGNVTIVPFLEGGSALDLKRFGKRYGVDVNGSCLTEQDQKVF